MSEERLELVTSRGPVSAVMRMEETSRAIVVMAHGAGIGMDHPLMVGFTEGLWVSGMGSLRFNFLYMEEGRKRPDSEPVLRDVYQAAYEVARERLPNKLIFGGGKSMGGRIASYLVADGMLTDGLIFIGYPFHPPGHPEKLRTEHLSQIKARMLFLQGSKDPFAQTAVLQKTIKSLQPWARLHLVEGGDHSCVVRGASQEETGRLLGGRAARFIQAHER